MKVDYLKSLLVKMGQRLRIDCSKSTWIKLLIFTAIKIMYTLTTVYLLNDRYYIGYGNYGVDYNFYKDLLGTLVFLLMTVFFAGMPKKGYLVDSLLTILFVLYYIPLVSAFSINNVSYSFFVQSNIYYFLILLFVRLFITKPKGKKSKSLRKKQDPICKAFDPPLVQLMCIVLCVFCIVHKILYNGFEFSFSLSADDVYPTRGEFQEYVTGMSGTLFSYIFAIVRNLSGVTTPFYLYYSLTQKKWFGIVLSVLSIFSVFSMSSSKSSLIFVLIVLVVAVLRNTRFVKNFSFWFSLGMLALLLICLLEYVIFDSAKIYILLIRRVCYIPAWLNTLYFEFFEQHAHVMWTQDTFLLQMVMPHQYADGVLSAINNYFFKGTIPSPNTGMFGEAYMHFGTVGIVIYPALLTAFFGMYQKIFLKYGMPFSLLVAAKLVLSLTNVPIVRTDFVLSYVLFAFAMMILPRIKIPFKLSIPRKKTAVVPDEISQGDQNN